MLIIPYRVKNPWKKFPVATITLIGLNVLIYLLTTHYGLVIRDEVVRAFAYEYGKSPLFNILASMFLHGNIMHLVGNMLFLWVFAPTVEERLGIPAFLLVYFTTGMMGDVLQGVTEMLTFGTHPVIGASGCVMGVMGAYWYLFSWSTVCLFYFFFAFVWIFKGVWLVHAVYLIAFYILLDLTQGIIFAGTNGVANFAHVGGGVAGALICLGLKAKRDSAKLSEAKAVHADTRNLDYLSLTELDVMRHDDPENAEIIQAMLAKALRQDEMPLLEPAFAAAGPGLIEKCPHLVARYLFLIPATQDLYDPGHLLRLALSLEDAGDPHRAIEVFHYIRQHHPFAPEMEQILFRQAVCYWTKLYNAPQARACLQELYDRFPDSPTAFYAENLRQQVEQA